MKCLSVLLCFLTNALAQELFQDADMESLASWACSHKTTCILTDERHSGDFAIMASGRTRKWKGVQQDVNVEPGNNYTVSMWVRLADDSAQDETVKLKTKYFFQDGTKQSELIAARGSLSAADGWVQLKGELKVPNKLLQKAVIMVNGPSPGVDFIADDASMKEVENTQSSTSELFKNADMESLSDWSCWGMTCFLTDTRQSGQYAIQTSGRTATWQGPSQSVNLEPGNIYSVSVWVKLVNDAGQLGQRIRMTAKYEFVDGSPKYKQVAATGKLLVEDGWVRLAGDMQVPDKPLKTTKLFVEGPDSGVEFITDNASLQALDEWSSWREDTENSINTLRKSSINIDVTVAADVMLNEVEITITQLKKSFPFGSAIKCDDYHHGDTRYQDFINQHFNWVVPENCLKWRAMEPVRGVIKFDRAFDAINKLKSNGIKVRGHNVVWSNILRSPDWVQVLWNDTLKQAVHTRVVDTVSQTQNLVEHWDVNNENLHGFFFQEHVYNLSYNLDIFRMAHESAPNVHMFLNEFDVVAGGAMTNAYLSQALQFKEANVGLYGIGVQCHFKGDQLPSPTLIKAHLDILAQAGVPIWVTELDVGSSDENTRAEYYETALRVLYAHPAVEGILMWGFWGEKHWRGDDAALVSGPEFILNAAGQRVLDLFENQWMTNETLKLSETGNHFAVAGFHGDYEVRVSYRGEELTDERRTFTLGEYSHDVSLSVE